MFKNDDDMDRGVLFFLVYVWLHIKRGTDAECWPWIGGRDSDGYGVMQYNNHPVRAIKVVYVLTKGDIPEGLQVLHTCPGGDWPACCNPAHLSLGTHAENHRQKAERGRCKNVGGPPKLTYEIAEEIRLRYARAHGKGVGVLAAEYGISRQMLTRIVQRKSWAKPPEENIAHSMGVNTRPVKRPVDIMAVRGRDNVSPA
jgi:hypothetical protein